MKMKVGLLSLLVMLQGCTASFDAKYDKDTLVKDDNKKISTTEESKLSPYAKYDTAFLGKQVSYNAKTQALLAKRVSIQSYTSTDLNTLMDTVSQQTGISFHIDTRVPGDKNGSALAMEETRNVKFDGTFEEFVRYISALYDVETTLDDNNVLNLAYYGSYSIKLDFFGENNTSESGLDLSGNASTSGGGLKGKSETKFESTFWDDVKELADKNVSSGVYTILKDASMLTFSGRPSEYRALSETLKKFQVDNNKQFVVTYKVFALDKKKLNSIAGGATVTYNDGGTTFNIKNSAVLDSMSSGMVIDRNFYTPTSTHALNVNAQMDALYQITGGKVIQSGTFVTRNNIPIPLNMTQSQYYVSGITKTTNDTTSVEDTAVETTELVTGTSFIITPRVMSDGRIEITSGFTKRYLNGIQDFGSVQLPKVTTSEMYNTAMLSAGSLMIVGKYEAKESTDGQSYMLLGASTDNNETTTTVVSVIGIDYYRAPFVEK